MGGHRLDPGRGGLFLRHPHGRDLRFREDDAWNRSILRAHGPGEDVRAGDPPLVLAHVGERHDPGDVADCPDSLRRATALVHLDPLLAGLDAHVFKRQFAQARLAADGDDQLIGGYLLVGEANGAAVPCGADGRDFGAQPDIDVGAPEPPSRSSSETLSSSRLSSRSPASRR